MNHLYFEIYFEKSVEYYKSILMKLETGSKLRFNLAAFLFGIFWLLYRKMYKTTFWTLGFILFMSIIAQTGFKNFENRIEVVKLFQFTTNILLGLFLGFYGNWLYIRTVKKDINKITLKFENNDILIQREISKVGGVSFVPVIIALTIFSSIIFVANVK